MSNGIAAALALLPALGAGVSMGLAVKGALDAIARQPEAGGKISSTLLIGLALVESIAIYSFVIALILASKA